MARVPLLRTKSQLSKVFVIGHNGMVGSAIVRKLAEEGLSDIITAPREVLDLTNQSDVQNFIRKVAPDQIYIAAAKVGGIHANNRYPAEFIYENIMIQTNIIHAAFLSGVKKILFLGSSCIYPKAAEQPMSEECLLTGQLEPTNEPYAIAKITGIKLCESYNRQYGKSHDLDYRSVMPTNLYGTGDNFHPENSHVIPGLIHRFHQAIANNNERISIWGTGLPKREFLHVDDLAEACVHFMNLSKKMIDAKTRPMCSHINIGSGNELSIKELAETIKDITGFKGRLEFDITKPDGPSRKLVDSQKILELGWEPKIKIKDGLRLLYEEYKKGLINGSNRGRTP